MVPPLGIEPSSSVLQTGAMTTFAKAAIKIGVASRSRTDGFADLQSTALGLSATATLFGVPPGTRTPTDSFGDCGAAITPEIQIWHRRRESNSPKSDRQSGALPRGLRRYIWYPARVSIPFLHLERVTI